ncbi:MmgE/PrpD family protein [Hydrogenophaga sp.]|uniref:MmgE/PrpD family protein n=1 Tax=Hydrogenophaga sp. TaxID=1904254 RepID=UPI002726597F|nr:MmgE/PrpD family protein [Hydrogenophaga sp.]MDO9439169.1 MmgE/PrpD family protein [Hydrogenophaga sp.]
MDKISKQLVRYASGFEAGHLSASALTAASALLFDTVACGVAGCTSAPAQMVARLAGNVQATSGATLIGGAPTSPELAALANTMMVRTYDYNDAYYGHPSDMIPGVLAAGEMVHASGMDVLASIALAYEVYAAFARSAPYHLDSWLDQGVFMNVAVALAVGRLWRLNEEQLANAASLALVPNLPLGVSRWGTLSMMKGCATAFAVRNGVFAAMLAREGFTSAPEPYEGTFGLHKAIGPFDLRLPVDPDMRVVEMAYIKPIPAENNTIGLLELAPEIRAWTSIDAIDSIDIELATGLEIHLADASKYDPKTRESADHSLPYMLARALVDGAITLGTYAPDKVSDASIRPLMNKIRVSPNAEMKAMMRASIGAEAKPANIRVQAGGKTFARTLLGHSGHPERPAQERQAVLDRKLDLCAAHSGIGDPQRERIREAFRSVAEVKDISQSMKTLAGLRAL